MYTPRADEVVGGGYRPPGGRGLPGPKIRPRPGEVTWIDPGAHAC
jgi:hypothetical protein